MEYFTNFVTKGISAEEIDSRRIVKGHITVEVVDKQNEFVAVDEVLNIMKSYMDWPNISDWHSNRMVGKALSYKKSQIDGHPSIYIEAEIFKKDGVTLYDTVWNKIVKGEYCGFSMGGASKVREPRYMDGKLIMNLKGIELYEIAVCPYPINPLAVIDYVSEFAKASNLGVLDNDGKHRIQCAGVQCEFGKATTEAEVEKIVEREHELLGHAPDKKEAKIHEKLKEEVEKSHRPLEAIDSDVDVDKDHTGADTKNEDKDAPKIPENVEKSDNIKVTNENSNVYKALSETVINNMSTDTQIQTQPTTPAPVADIVKSGGSEISLLTTLVTNHDNALSALTKSIADIQKSVADVADKLQKGQDANPVTHAPTAELKPAVSDAKDVGASAESVTGIAPKGDAQASIIAPAGEPSGTGSVSKADKPEEKEEEKPEMKKSTDGFTYEMVKAIRPKYGLMPETPQGAPTAFQIQKAINSGFGGKFTNYEQSFIHAWTELVKGNYGTGFPGGN